MPVALWGCAGQRGIALSQPQLTGLQQELRLDSEQVTWSDAKGPLRVVGEFPLPGASTGQAAFVLYLRLKPAPGAKNGTTIPCALSGFLIQTRGENAGLAMITDGGATAKGTSTRPGALCVIELHAAFDDGSSMAGTVWARRDDRAVSLFEHQRYAADVRAVVASAPSK